jgi:uncharacterized protein (UPF0332 family)
MIRASVLLTIVDELAIKNNNPSQEHLRRAVSTNYYAMFHALCKLNADILVGRQHRTTPAWVKVYRALDHAEARKKCNSIQGHFDRELRRFAKQFCQLQSKRHAADYDPSAVIQRKEVLIDLMVSSYYISNLDYIGWQSLREFAVYLLFRDR